MIRRMLAKHIWQGAFRGWRRMHITRAVGGPVCKSRTALSSSATAGLRPHLQSESPASAFASHCGSQSPGRLTVVRTAWSHPFAKSASVRPSAIITVMSIPSETSSQCHDELLPPLLVTTGETDIRVCVCVCAVWQGYGMHRRRGRTVLNWEIYVGRRPYEQRVMCNVNIDGQGPPPLPAPLFSPDDGGG